MQSYSNSQLGIQSNKKPSQRTVANDLLLVNRNSTVLFRGKSQDLSTLTKQSKLKQMDTLYDHYNLFKYSKVITGDQTGRVRNSVIRHTKGDNNPEIKKYKNGLEARKQSTQLKLRLGELKDERKGVMNQIKKMVITDKR